MLRRIRMVKCSNCGSIRTKANHWWTIEYILDRKSMFIRPYVDGDEKPYDWTGISHEVIDKWKRLAICSIDCLVICESRIRNGEEPVKEIPA